MIQSAVSCLDNHICYLLFGDGGANLHGAAGLGIDLATHLTGREGGAVYTITASSSTQHNDAIARLYLPRMTAVGQDTQAATEHQRVAEVSLVIEDRAIDCRYTHLIAVIAHAIDYAAGNAPGRKDAGWQLVDRRTRWTKAENVGTGDRPRGDAQHIADDAAHTRICSTERLYSRGMIMCFNLKSDILRPGKTDDAGVIAESRYQPGLLHLLRGPHEILFEQAVDGFYCKDTAAAIQFAVHNSGLEGFVRTVLRPGLRQCFQLNIGGLAFLLSKVLLYGSHLSKI